MIDAEPDSPYDRPNLSKDYLAGNAPEEWIPLRPARLSRRAPDRSRARRAGLGARPAEARGTARERCHVPVRPPAARHRCRAGPASAAGRRPSPRPLSPLARRQSRDHRARRRREARGGHRGELHRPRGRRHRSRTRGLDVHVVAPEKLPLERVMGSRARHVHSKRCTRSTASIFHLEDTATAIGERDVTLKSGGNAYAADLVVIGVGVRPRHSVWPNRPDWRMDRGVTVERVSGDERAARVRGRRHRALPRPVHRRAHPRRALGPR